MCAIRNTTVLFSSCSAFLFQWPTIVTLIMFPILVAMYVKLTRREEREVLAEFGERYRRYMVATPAFLPRFGQMRQRKEA